MRLTSAGLRLFRGGTDLKSLDCMIIDDRANAKWRLEHGTDAIRNHTFNTANWTMSLRNNAQEYLQDTYRNSHTFCY